jgi:hypothetical protein
MHQDFTEHGTWPRFAGIISLDGKGKIWMERLDLKGGKVELSLGAGDVVIFQGDKMHAGAAYDEEHRWQQRNCPRPYALWASSLLKPTLISG